MINIDNKSYILDKYYNEHEKPTIIAKELNVDPSYITKIIKKDARYEQEKEYRTQMINNYLNLLNNNILKQVKNYLILLK